MGLSRERGAQEVENIVMRIGTESEHLHVGVVAEMALGTEFAHAINTFKTAGGFARLGHRVTVICRPPSSSNVNAALASYGEPNLEVRVIPAHQGADADASSRSFSKDAARLAADLACDRIYGRNFYVAFEGPRVGIPTVIETHAHVGDARVLLDEVFASTRDPRSPLDGIITIAPALRDHYIARGADPDRVHLVPDGADPDLFAPPPERTAPAGRARPKAVYTGHLYDYKGIPTMIEAARTTPEIDWELFGGTDEDIARVRPMTVGIPNITVRGRVDHAQVPRHLWDADVLVLPPTSDHPSARWTSPVKLAEYLWADRPIAASRIPGIENWVAAPAVEWFTPDDAAALARCVRGLISEDGAMASKRREARAAAARRYTYAARAAAILRAMRPRGEKPASAGPRVA